LLTNGLAVLSLAIMLYSWDVVGVLVRFVVAGGLD
jgi:hypothetical protein